MTVAEKILWNELQDRKFFGMKFLRQHPLFCVYEGRDTFFVADFYCHERLLAVELDGKIHDNQKERDELRTHLINTKGVRVVRFKNEEVENSVSSVLEQLKRILTQT